MKANGLFESSISWTHVSAVKVLSLYAKKCPSSVPDSYKNYEIIKNLKYRILKSRKHSWPFIFSCTWRAAVCHQKPYLDWLPGSIIRKKNHIRTWSCTLRKKIGLEHWISSILYLRGNRSMRWHPAIEDWKGVIVEGGMLLS